MNWPDDFINKIICGDCLEVMKEMPDETIDMVLTSPPYWGLRDYGIGPDQLGLEPTPEMYIEHLTEIFNEVKRVLKKEGTFWLNCGDTYGGSSGGYYPYENELGASKVNIKFKGINKPKCLCMIPERLAWSLIQNGWILRNKIIWRKKNHMPASVQDRLTNAYEFIYLFSQDQKYYFDLDNIREPHSFNRWSMSNVIGSDKAKQAAPGQTQHSWQRKGHSGYYDGDGNLIVHPLGKNPGDVWDINLQPFPEAHFAVFPEKLCEKPIKAGCPEEVCKKCGKARERIVEKEVEFTSGSGKAGNPPKGKHENSVQSKSGSYDIRMGPQVSTKTIGWTSCKCHAGFEGGIILDPFAGAGTALYVAKELRRRFIGIDIKQKYCDMCEKRLAQGVL